MADLTSTVEVKVAPKVAFGFSSKVGILSAAVLAVLTAVNAILNSGELNTEGIATLAGALLALYKTMDVRGNQATAAINAVAAEKVANPSMTITTPVHIDGKQVAQALSSPGTVSSGPQNTGKLTAVESVSEGQDFRMEFSRSDPHPDAEAEMSREPEEQPTDDGNGHTVRAEDEIRDLHEGGIT